MRSNLPKALIVLFALALAGIAAAEEALDIGKSHVAIGVVHRGKLSSPAPDSGA